MRESASTFVIVGDVPCEVNDAASKPKAGQLTTQELLINFPGRVRFMCGDETRIELADAPVLGVLSEVAEALLRLRRGAGSTKVVDFYGEYGLEFEKSGDVLRCTNSFGGGAVEVPWATFVDAALQWHARMQHELEARFPSLTESVAYGRLLGELDGCWTELGA